MRRRVALVAALLIAVAVAAVVLQRRPAAPPFSGSIPNFIVEGDLHVDLTVPASPAAWIVFVRRPGSFAPDENDANAVAFADTMQRRGIAVATVTLGANTDLEALTARVHELQSRVSTYGITNAMTLVGDRRGAAHVAQLAMDGSLGVAHVITFNGVFDALKDLPTSTTVPFLVLTAHGDTPAAAQSSRRFTNALRRSGSKNVHRHHVSARNERSLTNLAGERNDVADLVTAFVRDQPLPGGPDSPWAIDDEWDANPPLSSTGFGPAARKPADAELRAHIAQLFGERVGDLEPWPAETYDAIDLDAYLQAHPELGAGEWLTLENARGERLVFPRAELRKKKAELVVGLDDEPNLFRLFVTYNVYRTYSWKPEQGSRRLLVRPVGAFLHFPDGTLPSRTHAEFAVTSLRVTADDPLASARSSAVLTNDQGCLQCHAFRGGTARSHHLRAADGALAEAFALPLAEYPPDVLRRFLFEQDKVAESFGVGPLEVEPAAANELLAMTAH